MIRKAGANSVVSVNDAAVDVAAMGTRSIGKYVRERDAELLQFVKGEKPTWFELRRIPTSLFTRYIMEGRSDSEQYLRAFICGVERVRDLVDVNGEFRALLEPLGEAHTPTGTLKVWRDEDVDLIPPVYVEEIGSVALIQSMLSPKARASCQLPPMSLLGLTGRTFQPVAETLEDALQSSEEARERPPSSSDADGGVVIGAPVTETLIDVSAGSQTPTP